MVQARPALLAGFVFGAGLEDEQEPVRIPVTDVFDLHSVPPRDVKGVVEEYLLEARRLGFRALRIVHGRGIGVQREMVRSILARTGFVADFHDAPAEAGGWGATVVTLREDKSA
jgi:dsDNA-specific endonuclease/ATPase MutS2